MLCDLIKLMQSLYIFYTEVHTICSVGIGEKLNWISSIELKLYEK